MFNIISSTRNRVCGRGGGAPSFSSLRSDSSISGRGDYWSLLENITSFISLSLSYYILFDLTLLNKVVYLVLWYRGDEGEPIYRYSHCDHYSDRHKIDKLTCDIKAGFILSFGILQRFFFILSRYLLIRDFTAINKSWMVLWSDLYGLSDQIYLADHNWDIPPTRAWIPIQTRKCRIHLSPDICDVLKFILDFAYLAKI